MANALDVLRNRNFRIYWVSQAVSLVGTWMQAMAQAWVVTSRSESASVLGALNIVGSLPMLLLALKAGELADRVDKRRLLLTTQAVLAVLALAAALLAFWGRLEIWHLFVLALLFGTAAAFEMPVSQAVAPELVAPHEIPRAVGLMQAIFHGSRLVGPALAGLCIQAFGEGSAFLANSLSFMAVILGLVLIRPRGAAVPAPARPHGSGGFREGITFVRGSVALRSLLGVHVLAMVFAFPFVVVLMPHYARSVLHADASAMGQLMSAGGVGSLAASVMIVVLAAAGWRARLWVGVAGLAASLVGLSAVDTRLPALVLLATTSFFTSTIVGTIMQTAQQQVPGALRGRVMSLFGMVFTGVLPFSGLLLAALSDRAGLTRVMAVCAGLFFLASVIALALMERALRREAAAQVPPVTPQPAAADPA